MPLHVVAMLLERLGNDLVDSAVVCKCVFHLLLHSTNAAQELLLRFGRDMATGEKQDPGRCGCEVRMDKVAFEDVYVAGNVEWAYKNQKQIKGVQNQKTRDKDRGANFQHSAMRNLTYNSYWRRRIWSAQSLQLFWRGRRANHVIPCCVTRQQTPRHLPCRPGLTQGSGKAWWSGRKRANSQPGEVALPKW